MAEEKKTEEKKKVEKTAKKNELDSLDLKKHDAENLIADTNLFLSSGVHIGMKFKNKLMEKYIYKTRSDGLNVLNVQMISDRTKIAGQFLAKFEPQEILVVGRKGVAKKTLEKFSELTGIKVMPGRYLPGIMTNPNYEEHYEPKVLIVTDPWQDKNSLHDALKIGIPIVGLCDTSTTPNDIDVIIPCNNKSPRSTGFIYWLLAREYLRNTGKIAKDAELGISYEDFVGDVKSEEDATGEEPQEEEGIEE